MTTVDLNVFWRKQVIFKHLYVLRFRYTPNLVPRPTQWVGLSTRLAYTLYIFFQITVILFKKWARNIFAHLSSRNHSINGFVDDGSMSFKPVVKLQRKVRKPNPTHHMKLIVFSFVMHACLDYANRCGEEMRILVRLSWNLLVLNDLKDACMPCSWNTSLY